MISYTFILEWKWRIKNIRDGIYIIIYIHIQPKGHGCDKYEHGELF